MDTHHVGRGKNSTERTLGLIKAKTLVIGIKSDQLFPPAEQAYLAEHIPNASLQIIDSPYGHDGFLVETTALSQIIEQNSLIEVN
jgi:homoserine O-acetyltransferase